MTIEAGWATAAYAYGYGEHGTFPVPRRAIDECRAIEEAHTPHRLGPLVIEAGRAGGHRAKRNRQHIALYSVHTTELATALEPILKRIDTEKAAAELVALAAQNTASGASPVERRASVAAHARHYIDATPEELAGLHAINASGWAHATAYGQAEAQQTSAKGGPPNTAKVAAAAAVALRSISHDEAVGATTEWGVNQLNTIAMGVALAAGDGAALGDATRKVTAALLSTGRATRSYTDALHSTVNATFVQSVLATTPEALFNFVNGGADPCDDCTDDALESPYAPDDLPDCPEHPGCLCDIELAAPALVAA